MSSLLSLPLTEGCDDGFFSGAKGGLTKYLTSRGPFDYVCLILYGGFPVLLAVYQF
ncbi:hypothetical protein [Staphylococcus epidermidis]|uniref:hypothetical protein n=1 Tax=Staphylococcus epidermidis TaxID=1282 RepID=UPI001EEEC18F|nr:hypothetical protein [Staphylococcus epidermidis]